MRQTAHLGAFPPSRFPEVSFLGSDIRANAKQTVLPWKAFCVCEDIYSNTWHRISTTELSTVNSSWFGLASLPNLLTSRHMLGWEAGEVLSCTAPACGRVRPGSVPATSPRVRALALPLTVLQTLTLGSLSRSHTLLISQRAITTVLAVVRFLQTFSLKE